MLAVWCKDLFWEPRDGIVDILAEVCAVVIVLAVCGVLAFFVWAAPSLVVLALLVLALLVLSVHWRGENQL